MPSSHERPREVMLLVDLIVFPFLACRKIVIRVFNRYMEE